MTESTASQSSGSGRHGEFETFFADNWPAVLAFCRRRTATLDDATDVAAETFTVTWRRFDEIPADRPQAWLYRTAHHVLANHRRSRRRRTRLEDRVARLPVPAPVHPVDVAIDDQAIIDAFATLTDEQRDLLMMVAWDGLDHGTIADVLEISANAVALRVKRARAALDDALAEPDGPAATDDGGAGHVRGDRAGRQP